MAKQKIDITIWLKEGIEKPKKYEKKLRQDGGHFKLDNGGDNCVVNLENKDVFSIHTGKIDNVVVKGGSL